MYPDSTKSGADSGSTGLCKTNTSNCLIQVDDNNCWLCKVNYYIASEIGPCV